METSNQSFKKRDKRRRINENVIHFERACAETKSERAAAKLTGQPRSTAQYHAKRLIQRIYELSGLDRWVACSLGSLSQRIQQMENHLIAYGETQEMRLVAQMERNQAITCCLVGIEPVSNFILLEEMTAKRDAATWAEAMGRRLSRLPVNGSRRHRYGHRNC